MASVNVIGAPTTLALDGTGFEAAWEHIAEEPENPFVLFEHDCFPFIARVPAGLDPLALRQAIDSTIQEYMTPPFTRLLKDLDDWIRLKGPSEEVIVSLAGSLHFLYQQTTTSLEAAGDFAKVLERPLLLSDSAVQFLPLSSKVFPCSSKNFATFHRMLRAFDSSTITGLRSDYGKIVLRDADAALPIEPVDAGGKHTLLSYSFLKAASAHRDEEPRISGEAQVALKLLEFPSVTSIPRFVRGLLLFVKAFFPEHLQAFNEDMVKIGVALGVEPRELQFLNLPVELSGPLKDPLKLFPSRDVAAAASFCVNHGNRWTFVFDRSIGISRAFGGEIESLKQEGEVHWNARKDAPAGSFARLEAERKHAEIVSKMEGRIDTTKEQHRHMVLSFDGPFPFVANSFHGFFQQEKKKNERKAFARTVFHHELKKDPEANLLLLALVHVYYEFDLQEMMLELMHEDEAIRELFMRGAQQRTHILGAFCLDVLSAYCKKDESGKVVNTVLAFFFAEEEDFDKDDAAERLFIILNVLPEAQVERTLRFLFARWVGLRGLELSPEGATVHLEDAGIFRQGFDPLYLKEMIGQILDDAKGKKAVDNALETARLPSGFDPTRALGELEDDASVALMETVEIDMEDVLPHPTRFYIRPVKNRRDGEKRAWSIVLRTYTVSEGGVRQSAMGGTIRDGVYNGDETRPEKREMLRRLGILAAHRYYVREKEKRARSSTPGSSPSDGTPNPTPNEFRLIEGREGTNSITLDISTRDEAADRQADAVLRTRVGENLSRVRRILVGEPKEEDVAQVEVYEESPSPVRGKILYRRVASDMVRLTVELDEFASQAWFVPVTTPHTQLAGCYDSRTEGGLYLVESKQPTAHSIAGYSAYRENGGEELNLNPYQVHMNLRADARVDSPELVVMHLADEVGEPVITLLEGKTAAPLDGKQESLTARICQQIRKEDCRVRVADLLHRVSTLQAVVEDTHSQLHDAALAEMSSLYGEIGRLLFEPGEVFPTGRRFRVELPLQVELENPRVFNQGTFVRLNELVRKD